MTRPDTPHSHRTGYTLVEILVASTLALMLMGSVIAMFATFGDSVTGSRSMLESADRLRLAQSRLQMDLAGVTATVSPSLRPEDNQGYFEYIEGPAMCEASGSSEIAVNIDDGGGIDLTVGDFDDILMFTTRSTGEPFVGRYYDPATGDNVPIESDVAEVAWFLRGRTLHRRVLLVAPNVTLSFTATPYYAHYDISARVRNGVLFPNTLGNLTQRENRFAHPYIASPDNFPYDVRQWHWIYASTYFPTLPTLQECTSAGWTTEQPPQTHPLANPLDMWAGSVMPDNAFGSGIRISDDVILTNVIGFDVKAWDPTAPNVSGGLGAYVDLGYLNDPTSRFSHVGQPQSQLAGSANTARVYDTWSTAYYDDSWNDGLDNGASGPNGIVDDDSEKLYPPPYPVPLRGIQVKIRVFEPDSRQVREVTVEHEFLPR